jgi:twitching motility protein PilT
MIQTGKKYGMQLLDDAIMDLLQQGRISPTRPMPRPTRKARSESAG